MNTSIAQQGPLSKAGRLARVSGVALRRIDHGFYLAMSLAIAITVFAGFARSFYLRNYFHRPPLHLVTEIHGILNTGWILLFVFQNALITAGRPAIHRRLGWAGAVLSLLLVPFSIGTGIDAVRQGHHVNSPDIYAFLLTFSFRNTIIFAILMGAAIYFRRNPETHKRLALLAAIALFAEPSIGRIPGLSFVPIVLLILAFFFAGPTYDFITRHRIHPAYARGIPAMLILGPLTPLTTIASRTSTWHHFTDWLIR